MTCRADQTGKVIAPASARMLRYCCDRNLQIDAVSISPLTLRLKIHQTLGMHEPLYGRKARLPVIRFPKTGPFRVGVFHAIFSWLGGR
jgi:hypothetical protein